MDSGSIRQETSEQTRPSCHNLRLCALHTDEGGDLGVDDAAGKEVKVVLHRVHHHRVSRVVAALQRRVRDTDEKQDKQQTSQTAYTPVCLWVAACDSSKNFPCEREYFLSRGKTPDRFLSLSRPEAGRGAWSFTDRFAGRSPQLLQSDPSNIRQTSDKQQTAEIKQRRSAHVSERLVFNSLEDSVHASASLDSSWGAAWTLNLP